MQVSIRVSKTKLVRKVASTELRRYFAVERVFLDDFIVTVYIHGINGKKHEYTGSVFSRADEITKALGLSMRLGLLDGGTTRIFTHDERPILSCVYKSGDSIRVYGLCRLFFEPRIFCEIQPWMDLSRLRRIRLTHCNIRIIPDLSYMRLTYLNLSHNCISASVFLPNTISILDLSHNSISEVVRARACSLNLSNNKIASFSHGFSYQHLNVSHNPLRRYSGKAQVLNLSYTLLKTLGSTASRKIYLDGTKGVKLKNLDSLRFLSLDGCGLRGLSFKAKDLRVLKARNNLLESIPRFPSLECLDVSGNLIYRVMSEDLKFLNAAKNQFIRFNLSAWKQLKHLDLSYNPIVEFDLKNIPPTLKFLDLYGTGFSGPSNGARCLYIHRCTKRNKVARKFVFDGAEGVCRKFLAIAVVDPELSISRIFEVVRSKLGNPLNPLSYLRNFHLLFQNLLFAMDIELEYALCMITSKYVIVRRNALNLMFSNFAEIKVLDDSETTYVYDNVGNWNLIPLFCDSKYDISRFDIADTFGNELRDILDFINYRCPVALNMTVSNMHGLYDECSVGLDKLAVNLLSNDLVYGYGAGEGVCSEESNPQDLVFGYGNYNSVLDNPMRRHYTSLLSNPNPVFAFCRFKPRDEGQGYRCIAGNVRNIVRMANHIFFGTNLEFFSDYFIVAFNDRVESCLWALKIQDMLQCLKLEVGVGITSGVFYTKIVDNHVRFYGPALIKAARLSRVGFGVFCCHCVWSKHAKVVYVEQGSRHLEGFRYSHPIYTPKVSDEAA